MIQIRHRKLFVGGVDGALSESELREYFSHFGCVTGCTLHRDRDTGRSRGFGFVTFKDADSVDRVQSSRPHTISHCEVTTKRAVPRELFAACDGLLSVSRLFVGGLREDAGEQELRLHFQQFGPVRRVEMAVERETRRPRGFAFIEFDDHDPVDKAVLKGEHRIAGREVTVRKAKSRLEMELLRHHGGGGDVSAIHPLFRSRSSPFCQPQVPANPVLMHRHSLDSFECPFHYDSMAAGRFF